MSQEEILLATKGEAGSFGTVYYILWLLNC